MKKELTNQEYAKRVKQLTPKFSSFSNCWHAFVSGGAICGLGEIIRQIAYNKVGVNEENSYIVVSICLVFLSVILTGFQVYEPLAKWCGAGTLVPITGFANSVASPAIEYQKEGQVFGIGIKIFTIAGPVILYGVLALTDTFWQNIASLYSLFHFLNASISSSSFLTIFISTYNLVV